MSDQDYSEARFKEAQEIIEEEEIKRRNEPVKRDTALDWILANRGPPQEFTHAVYRETNCTRFTDGNVDKKSVVVPNKLESLYLKQAHAEKVHVTRMLNKRSFTNYQQIKQFLHKAIHKKSPDNKAHKEKPDEAIHKESSENLPRKEKPEEDLEDLMAIFEEGYQRPIKEPEISYTDFKPFKPTTDFENRSVIPREVVVDVQLNKIFSDWLEERFMEKHKTVVRTQGWRYRIDRNKVIFLNDTQKTFVTAMLPKIRDNINSICAAYYVRQLEQFPFYTLIFKQAFQDRPLLCKMRQQSHAYSMVDTYLSLSPLLDDQYKMQLAVRSLARIHLKYNLTKTDHKNHYVPLLRYLCYFFDMELYFVSALLHYFTKVSNAIVEQEKEIRAASVRESISLSGRGTRQSVYGKQKTWD